MSYSTMVEMAADQHLISRVAACAAEEGATNPREWATSRAWKIAATPEWDDKWQYAKDTATLASNPNVGQRPDVISDADILGRVQAIMTAESGAA